MALQMKIIKDRTVEIYAKNIENFFIYLGENNLNIKKINNYDINSYIEYIEKKYSHQKILLHLYSLKYFFKNILKNKRLEENIIQNIPYYSRNKPDIKIIETGEFHKILEKLISDNKPEIIKIRDLVILQLIIECGLTVSEISRLKIADIDLKNNLVIAYENERFDRYLHITTYTKLLIQEYLLLRNSTYEFLLYRFDKGAVSKQPLTPRTIQRSIAEYSNGQYSPKNFRYTFIINQLLKNKGIYEVSDLAGGIADNTKTIFREIYIKMKDKKISLTELDYKAYEYLRNRYGKKTINDILYLFKK